MIKYLIKLLQQTAGWIQNKNSIAVNYVIIKTKQLKNIAILTFLSVGVDYILTLNMHVSFQSIIGIIKTFVEQKTHDFKCKNDTQKT